MLLKPRLKGSKSHSDYYFTVVKVRMKRSRGLYEVHSIQIIVMYYMCGE